MRMVVPVNILGLPSCAVPVGCDDGLPQGVQLIGVRFREDLLLDAAQAVEDRAPVLTPIQPRAAKKWASQSGRDVGTVRRRAASHWLNPRRAAHKEPYVNFAPMRTPGRGGSGAGWLQGY
jgi:hypothetical protein